MTDPGKLAALTVSIYNPANLEKEDLIRGFVAHQSLLDHLLDDLRREGAEATPQHHLIIGQRGLGKTTLLRRLAYAVEDDAELARTWIALVFPEEQYNVASLGDFWLNCVDALSDALDRAGDRAASEALDERVERVPSDRAGRSAAALALLTGEAERLQRRLLLLVDNIDILFDRLDREQEWEFRRVISDERRLHFMGASSRVLETLYEHGRAFYDFFQVHELKGLDDGETFAVLRRLAGESGAKEVERLIEEQPGRIRALRLLTGGNPRTLVLLYKVLAEGRDGDVQRDVEQLLDLYTPLYKARFEDLPAQAQQLVDAMAIHWDPLTAADLTDLLRPLPVNQVSAQLKRLEDLGVVEKAPWFGEKKTAFQIAERFFNIWYLMRASRRVRRKLLWLVKFLEAWFDREELGARAREFLDRDPEAVGDRHLRRSLESAGLHAVVDLGIDFSDLPPELQDKKDRMQHLRELKEKVCGLRIEWGDIEPKEFWRLLGGSPHLSLAEKARIVEGLPALRQNGLRDLHTKLKRVEQSLLQTFRKQSAEVAKLYEALAAGDMADVYDWEGAVAIAQRWNIHWLPFIAIGSRLDWTCNPEELSAEEFEEAESVLRELAAEPGFESDAWTDLGHLLQSRSKRFDDAEKAYLGAISFDPRDAYPRNGLGNLLRWHTTRYEESERAYRQAIELEPRGAAAWNNIGVLLDDHLKRRDEAEQAYRQSIELDRDFAYPWSNLGRLLSDTPDRQHEAAEAHLRALEIEPTRSGDLESLLRICERLSQSDLTVALSLVQKAHEAVPDNRGTQFLLARLLTLSGKWHEASPLLEQLASAEGETFSTELFQAVGDTAHTADAIAILERTGAHERWRPLYEALRAAGAGSPDYLNRVAPEVRTVAMKILRQIAPRLFSGD